MRVDMVDLADVGRFVAEGVVALAVANLDGSASCSGEESPSNADIDDARGAVEDDSLDPGAVEPG